MKPQDWLDRLLSKPAHPSDKDYLAHFKSFRVITCGVCKDFFDESVEGLLEWRRKHVRCAHPEFRPA